MTCISPEIHLTAINKKKINTKKKNEFKRNKLHVISVMIVTKKCSHTAVGLEQVCDVRGSGLKVCIWFLLCIVYGEIRLMNVLFFENELLAGGNVGYRIYSIKRTFRVGAYSKVGVSKFSPFSVSKKIIS